MKPTPKEVAERLLILKYQVVHALASPPTDLLNQAFSRWPKEDQQSFLHMVKERSEQLVTFMKAYDLWDRMTKEEREFIKSTPMTMKPQQHLNAMWRMESAIVLIWALGRLTEFPVFDAQTNTDLLKDIPYENINEFLDSAVLIPEGEIEKRRSLAELWHWRSRTRELIEKGQQLPSGTPYASFNEIVSIAANEAYKRGDLSQVLDDDFPVRGKPYRILTEEEWSEIRSITIERHHALNWLCGHADGNKWNRTPTDT